MKSLSTSFIRLMKVLEELVKPKRHDQPLIQPIIGFESCFPPITFMNPNMMITTL